MTDHPKTADIVVHLSYGPLHLPLPGVVDHVLVSCSAQKNPANSPEAQKLAPDATECEFGGLPPDNYIITARALTAPDTERNTRARALGTPDASVEVTIGTDNARIAAVLPHRAPRGHVPPVVRAEPPVVVQVPHSLTVTHKDDRREDPPPQDPPPQDPPPQDPPPR
jgi:hypothetical protein